MFRIDMVSGENYTPQPFPVLCNMTFDPLRFQKERTAKSARASILCVWLLVISQWLVPRYGYLVEDKGVPAATQGRVRPAEAEYETEA